ncbi:hypothetical protein R6Q57_009483 [Mikania cordata]
MADPAQTPVGTNTGAAKSRRDETPTSTHPYLSDMTNLDAPIIIDYLEEEAGGFRIMPNPTIPSKGTVPVDELLTTLLEAIRSKKESAGKAPGRPAQVENDESLDSLLQPYHPTNFTDMSKFTKRIAKAPLREKLKVPLNVGKYDGSSDPDDHLHAFAGVGKVRRWNLPTWCHMLVQTLTGAACLSFDSLPLGSIDSYEELRDKFLKQFNQKKKAIKIPMKYSIYGEGTARR